MLEAGIGDMVRTAYNRETAYSYDEKRFLTPQGKVFDQLEKEQLLQVLHRLNKPAQILEVGCGTGRFLELALASDRHTVWGVDPSPFMLEVTRGKNLDFGRLQLVCAEGAFLPFPDDNFDLVYCIRVLNQIGSRDYAFYMIQEMLRVSKQLVLLEFVNRVRLVRKSERGTQLTITDVVNLLASFPSVRLVDISGILFFSQTALMLVPRPFLKLFVCIDQMFSLRLPHLCSRVYVTLEKVC